MNRQSRHAPLLRLQTPLEADVCSGMVVVKGPEGLRLHLTPNSAELTAALLWDAATKAREWQ
jgi:hypothetical protein